MLAMPVDLGSHHVAAGTNYPEHAGEAGVENGPFLFAKLVTPTAPRASVSVGHALLDYEVELAWVALDDIRDGTAPAEMGVILCNDYTDRETLLEHIDVWNVESGKGFTTGKSFPGYLPVGDLFVIPRDHRAFAAAREIALDVNGVTRQRSHVSAQVWAIDQLLAETRTRREQRWEHRGSEVALLADGDVLRARTLILSGTPAGTVFQDIGLTHKAKGVAAWILGGWNEPIANRVIDAYTVDPSVRALYLKPGDRVTIHADGLGVIDNQIVP
jgi:2-keto-4-pentenoate hydratase/2-oxohepta-3-ene-1,7-dioic acid hydratase in catechol pathway